jgi:hypothetical protein
MLEINEKRRGEVARKRIEPNKCFPGKLEYNTRNETKGSHFLLCVDLARKKPRSLRPCRRVI